MKWLTQIITIIVLQGCQIFENENQTRRSIAHFSEEQNCTISYETSIEYDKSEIKLFHNCTLLDDWEKGLFTYSLYKEFKKVGVYYDRLTLVSEEPGDSVYSRRTFTIKKIEKKLKLFLPQLEAFNQNNLDTIYSSFRPKLKSELSFKSFKRNYTPEKRDEELKLIGFKLINFKDKRRIYFCAKNDRNTLILSYDLNPFRNQIESIQFF